MSISIEVEAEKKRGCYKKSKSKTKKQNNSFYVIAGARSLPLLRCGCCEAAADDAHVGVAVTGQCGTRLRDFGEPVRDGAVDRGHGKNLDSPTCGRLIDLCSPYWTISWPCIDG